ncbi:MAG: sugar phosphate isomerase/epimerase [Firmicutes bacterium]|jgi:sugar phosphate isomerase/epimerase|nr:sugar phosphate isomerase/epimerase [Bacillota bacterium]
MSIPIGLQLYSLREAAAQDFIGVLKVVADMGYEGVEFAGYGGLKASQLRTILDDLGLKAVGSHVGFQQLDQELNQVIDFNLELGNHYIICPAPPRELIADGTADDWRALAEKLTEIGMKVKDQGLQLGYHNHSWEFKTFDGEYALDILFANVKPEFVVAEIDLGWTFHAGVDPVSYMQKHKGRCPLVHVKDFKKDGPQTEVGTGDVDLAGIVAKAPEVGVQWFVIETEEYNMDPKDSVRVGLENLRAVLQG